MNPSPSLPVEFNTVTLTASTDIKEIYFKVHISRGGGEEGL